MDDEHWQECSIHEVVASFLQSERDKCYAQAPPDVLRLIDAPDLGDPRQNGERLRLLYRTRRHLLGEIPPDTKWHRVRMLRDGHLPQLRLIARCGWDAKPGEAQDNNELPRAAFRHSQPLRGDPNNWRGVVLWGHDQSGPFTILEGNNRLAAYVSSGGKGLAIETFVGTSPSNCFWHIDDPPDVILNHLWKP